MKEYKPLVSIVIPVYNGANYMREAIDSAINQTYDNIEIIVVNDGSTDDGETEKIALSYGEKIKYYKKENGGCASSLNYGINMMQGEWFSWLSHDDVYYPDKIESAIEQVKLHNLDVNNTVIICESDVIDKDGKQLPHPKRIKRDGMIFADAMFSRFMNGRSLNGCSLMIPKAVLNDIGEFDTKYTYILDWIYWINISIAGYNFFEYPQVKVKNRKHSQQVSVKKRVLLRTETQNFIIELIDKVKNDNKKIQDIWLYSYQIGFKQGYNRCKKNTKISFNILVKGFKRRTISVAMRIVRKILHI